MWFSSYTSFIVQVAFVAPSNVNTRFLSKRSTPAPGLLSSKESLSDALKITFVALPIRSADECGCHHSRDHRIAFDNIGEYMVMFNPVIVKKSAPYDAEEGCLSLTGTRKTKRYQTIKVQWQNEQFQTRIRTFTGWTAQIIQHEIDHCEGILI